MDQTQPLPQPLPNDGSLNTELPPDMPLPPQKAGFNKRLGFIAVLSVFAAAGFFYTIASFPQNSGAKGKDTAYGQLKKLEKTATPTAVITQTEEQQVDSIDLGDVDTQMTEIDKDVNGL